MSRIFSITCLMGLLWQLFLPIPVMLDYAFRYQEYTEQLCENRTNPESNCHGSCQVTKILTGESPQNPEPVLPEFKQSFDWITETEEIVPDFALVCSNKTSHLSLEIYPKPHLGGLTPPPKVLC